jgi:hypothetical protein
VVYALGHDNSRHYIQKEGVHYIISGAAHLAYLLRKERNLGFGKRLGGFARHNSPGVSSFSFG